MKTYPETKYILYIILTLIQKKSYLLINSYKTSVHQSYNLTIHHE